MSGVDVKQEDAVAQDVAETMQHDASAAEQPGNKRKAEEGAGDEQPAAKAVKTGAAEGGAAEAADDAAAEAADDAAAGEGAADGAAAEEQQPPSEPVQIGYKTFASGKEAKTYYHNLISKLRKYQNLNDYEFHMVHELIRKGHPDAARKLEGGVKAVQVREVEIGTAVTACFFLVHQDGSDEDVSYRKCLATLFPELAKEMASSSQGARAGSKHGAGGGRGRGGRGRGGGRGGRGGRGRGRGRN